MTERTFLTLPEVTWVGIQAIVAIIGLFGLWRYVVHTKRLRDLADITRRAEVNPHYGISEDAVIGDIRDYSSRNFTLTNVGRGASLNTRNWSTHVLPPNYPETKYWFPISRAPLGVADVGDILPGKTEKITFNCRSLNKPRVYVVQGEDIEGGTSQIQAFQAGDGSRRLVMQRAFKAPVVIKKRNAFGSLFWRLLRAYRAYAAKVESSLD